MARLVAVVDDIGVGAIGVQGQAAVLTGQRAADSSGRAGFVAGGDERDAVRDERRDQELNAKNAKAQGQEKAADFALSGTINSLVDQVGKERVTFYQVDLKLIHGIQYGSLERSEEDPETAAEILFRILRTARG